MHGLTEDESRRRPAISALTLGGLLKHVTLNEQGWIKTVTDADPEAFRETAHHSGHADIIREELDGGNPTMTMAQDAGRPGSELAGSWLP